MRSMSTRPGPPAALVQAAHADAWEAIGRAGEAFGGGASRWPGVRVMASGLPCPEWNGADVLDPGADLARIAGWYAARRVPWGVRVPEGLAWPHGRKVLSLRLMAAPAAQLRAAAAVPGLTIRPAAPGDLEAVVGVDAEAFEAPPEVERPWLRLLLGSSGVTTAIGELAGEAVATGYLVRTDGDAGPASYVGGIAVLARARRRGVASAVTCWLLGGEDRPGSLAHLHAGTAGAARLYRRLGFGDVEGLDVYAGNG
jgi:ribosomal protein S18 acetylase RimI-like enzyme